MKVISRVIAVIVITAPMFARADWPQFRGPTHDGVSTEPMPASWPVEPRMLWKTDVADGFGSFAIIGDKAYFMIQTNGSEACCAVELRTGKRIWATNIDKTILRSSGGIGPRSTPLVDGNRIYVYSTYLKLACLDIADGKLIWQHDIAGEYRGQVGTRGIAQYGSACSPIVEGDLVIINGGGSGAAFMAFNKSTGEFAWKSGDDLITHATPTPATLGGARQAIFFTKSGLAGVDVKDGKILWRYAMASQQPVCASPVVSGDIVYCSAGYGVGAVAMRITSDGGKFSVNQLWRTANANMNHFSTPVVKDGYLYGIYGSMMQDTAPLECIELATAKRMWTGPTVGEGEVLLVDGKLVIQGSQGLLILAEPNPAGYKEISRARLLAGRAWGFPAYSNGVLMFRTDRQIAAVDLSGK